jgi:hypothetical protein
LGKFIVKQAVEASWFKKNVSYPWKVSFEFFEHGYKILCDNLGLLKPMAQLVCHLKLRWKSKDYYSSIFIFSPSKCINRGWSHKKYEKKSMKHIEQVGQLLDHENNVFQFIGLLEFIHFPFNHAFLPRH